MRVMSARINQQLDEIRDTSLELYNQHSLVDRICNLVSSQRQTNDFHTFQRETTLNRIELENNQIVRPDNMVIGIVRDEVDFILEAIRQNSQEVTSGIDIFQTIRTTANELRDEFLPNRIIIPRNLASQIPVWNKIMDPNAHVNFNELQVGLEVPLNVVRFPLNHPFTNMIITSLDSIFCEFVPDGNNRLHVGFDLDRGIQFPFWLRTILRLETIRNDAIRIILTS